MTSSELLLALAQTPLGAGVGMLFACFAIGGLYELWVNRPLPTQRELRRKRRAKRVAARKAR